MRTTTALITVPAISAKNYNIISEKTPELKAHDGYKATYEKYLRYINNGVKASEEADFKQTLLAVYEGISSDVRLIFGTQLDTYITTVLESSQSMEDRALVMKNINTIRAGKIQGRSEYQNLRKDGGVLDGGITDSDFDALNLPDNIDVDDLKDQIEQELNKPEN